MGKKVKKHELKKPSREEVLFYLAHIYQVSPDLQNPGEFILCPTEVIQFVIRAIDYEDANGDYHSSADDHARETLDRITRQMSVGPDKFTYRIYLVERLDEFWIRNRNCQRPEFSVS